MKAILECCLRPLKKHSQPGQKGHTLGAFPSVGEVTGAQQRERQSRTRMNRKVDDGIAKTILEIKIQSIKENVLT